MATYTYKCPNCDAELTYRPKTGDFGCKYCGSSFTKAELDALITAKDAEAELQKEGQKQEAEAAKPAGAQTAGQGEMNLYSCPSCGAQIVADDTTAATFCFYCHSPVILTGKLAGAYKPDKVIPFAVDKSTVQQKLQAWCRKKRYIDPAFLGGSQMEKLSGVYFPFWVLQSKVDAKLTAKATNLRVWMLGDTEYTETSVYDLQRGGEMEFRDVTLKALAREDVKILDGVYPYDMTGLQDFSMAYLSGFYAEKRDVEKKDVLDEARQTVQASANTLLQESIAGEGAISELQCTVTPKEEKWYYALLPAWMLTYRYGKETYYFAMNAQSGKIAGRVPLSTPKLNGLFGWVAGAVFLGMLVLRWLLWW